MYASQGNPPSQPARHCTDIRPTERQKHSPDAAALHAVSHVRERARDSAGAAGASKFGFSLCVCLCVFDGVRQIQHVTQNTRIKCLCSLGRADNLRTLEKAL